MELFCRSGDIGCIPAYSSLPNALFTLLQRVMHGRLRRESHVHQSYCNAFLSLLFVLHPCTRVPDNDAGPQCPHLLLT